MMTWTGALTKLKWGGGEDAKESRCESLLCFKTLISEARAKECKKGRVLFVSGRK